MTVLQTSSGISGFWFEALGAAHIEAIALGPDYRAFDSLRHESGMPETLAGWPGYAGLIEGRVAVVGGLIPATETRAILWMAAAPAMRQRHYLATMRPARNLLAFAHVRGVVRIEAHIRGDWAAAARWIAALGFSFEGRMRKFGPGGEDFDLYAEIDESAPVNSTLAEGG